MDGGWDCHSGYVLPHNRRGKPTLETQRQRDPGSYRVPPTVEFADGQQWLKLEEESLAPGVDGRGREKTVWDKGTVQEHPIIPVLGRCRQEEQRVRLSLNPQCENSPLFS